LSIFSRLFNMNNNSIHKQVTILGFKIKYNYLKKYLYILNNIPKIEVPENAKQSDFVWSMWWQGEDNAPEIVKICLKSIRKYYPQLIVIDENNYKNYIELPDYIEEKHKNNTFTNTHFSDIIRVFLLQKYGGTWIDATAFLSDYIPPVILKQNFYIFTNWNEGNIRSWFIHAKPEHYIMNVMKKFFEEYWKYENSLLNYYLFHNFFELCTKENSYFWNLFKKQPVCLVHQSSMALGDQQFAKNTLYHDKDMYDWIFNSSFVQKLSYKEKWLKTKIKDKNFLIEYIKQRLESQTSPGKQKISGS